MNFQMFLIAAVLSLPSVVGAADTVGPSASLTSPRFSSVTVGTAEIDVPNDRAPAQVAELRGRVTDDESGVFSVKVQIVRETLLLSGGRQQSYWNGATWQQEPLFLRAIIEGDTWLIPDVDFRSMDVYRIRLVATDNAGNVSTAFDNGVYTIQPTIDAEAPIGRIVSPAAFEIITPGEGVEEVGNRLPVGSRPIQFRITDDDTGVQRVAVQVFHFDSGEFFNGVEWQTEPAWIPVDVGDKIRLVQTETFAEVSFDRPGDYAIRMNLHDYAGNVSDTTENPVTILRVIEDTVLPTGQSVGPPPSRIRFSDGRVRYLPWTTSPGLTRVTGFADDDGTGVRFVKVQIERRAADRDYWNGNSWQAAPVWVRPNLLQTETQLRWRVFDVDLFESGEYIVRVSVCDNAGNQARAQQNPISYIVVP